MWSLPAVAEHTSLTLVLSNNDLLTFMVDLTIKISPLEIIIRKDNRPYWLKKLVTKIVKIYVRQFLEPQFDYLGKGGAYFKPRYIKVFGGNVSIDDYPTLIGSKDAHIQFTSWDIGEHKGEIKIGKFCLITPGVRIMSAKSIIIGDACMIAHGAYISDADWHGIYDRAEPVGNTKPVVFPTGSALSYICLLYTSDAADE